MSLIDAVNRVEKHFLENDRNVAELLKEGEIEFVIKEDSSHPKLICRNCDTKETITKVLYDPYNKFFYTRSSLENFKNVMFPFEKGEEEVIDYFQQAISQEYELDYEEMNERNEILLKLSDFASLLKEEKNKEQKRIDDLGSIEWISEEEFVAVDRWEVPMKKETKTFIQLGYSHDRQKYVVMESEKTYINDEMLDVSQKVLEFRIESLEVILDLFKKVLGKTLRLS